MKSSPKRYLNSAKRAWKEYCNSIFPTEEDFLEHLFFTNGNGYDWTNTGKLVCEIWMDKEWKKEKERLYGNTPNISFEEWRTSKSTRSIYPICEYAKCVTFPENIKPDWKKALIRALNWAETAEHYLWTWHDKDTGEYKEKSAEEKDHKWIQVAWDKLKKLEESKK